MRDAVRKPWETAVPVVQANRRRASESLDDVPHRLRLPSYPADRLHDLYGSLSTLLGMSQREAASRFGIARETVKKMLRHSEPPGYRRRERAKRLKLDPYIGIIDQYLNEDRTRHCKQRHTAKRIFDRLRGEHGFEGGYTIVKDYVREYRRRRREMFVPLANPVLAGSMLNPPAAR